MRRLLISFCFLTASYTCFAQELALELFMCDTATSTISDIAFCSNGGYFICSSDRITSSNWLQQGFLKKYSSTHQLLWERRYGGSKGDYLQKLIWLAPDRLLMCGSATSTDGDLSGISFGPTAGNLWMQVVDTNGIILHANTWGYGNSTHATDVKVTSDGHIYAYCGTGANFGDFVANNLAMNWLPALVYADTQLNKKWVKVFDNSVSGSAAPGGKISIVGGKVVCTALTRNDTFGVWKPIVDTGDYDNTYLFWVDSMQQTTKHMFGTAQYQHIIHTLPHSDTTAYICSYAVSEGGVGPDTPLPSDVVDCYVISKLNLLTGKLFGWKSIFGEFGGPLTFNGNLNIRTIAIVDSLLWVVYSIRGIDDKGFLGQGIDDNLELYITAVSLQTGGIVAKKRFSSGCDYDAVWSLKTNTAGEIFLTSAIDCKPNQTWSPPGTCASTNAEYGMGVVYKLSMWPTATKPTLAGATEYWQLFPNPTKGNFYVIRYSTSGTATIILQDAAGKTLMRKQFESTSYAYSTDGLAPGQYIVTLRSNGVKSSKKLVVE
jgi:hypothetical protein